MLIIGCDYHPSVQQIAFADTESGDYGEQRLKHSDGEAEKFYRNLKLSGVNVRVGLEATGHSRWFERLLSELGWELWIGDAAQITAMRVRKQKTDRQDAQFLLKLMMEGRFPRVWMPSPENRDLRQLLWHRHRLVQMRARILNQLQSVAMNEGIQRRGGLRSEQSRKRLEQLPLAPWATQRRQDLLALLDQLDEKVKTLTAALQDEAEKRPDTQSLMTHPGVGDSTCFCTDYRVPGALSMRKTDRQLHRTDSSGDLEWRTSAVGSHQQARQFSAAFPAGGGSTIRSTFQP
jgi:transposase